ncbi:MAG: hypothetical protein WA766_09345 [Candidatus Acidiferrales bacterium]
MNITGRQWEVLASDVSAGAAVLAEQEVDVLHIEFSNYTSSTADHALVVDRLARTVWAPTGASDNEEVRSGRIGWCDGLTIPIGAITSGRLLIYIR